MAMSSASSGADDPVYLEKANQFLGALNKAAADREYITKYREIENKQMKFGITDARAMMVSMKRWLAKEAMDQRYTSLKETIGKGAFGKVCAYMDLNRKQEGLVRTQVAIKKVNANDEGAPTEIGINLYLGNHPNIVPIEYVYESKIRYYLVMPRYFSDLFHHCNNSQVSDITRKSWIKDICTGLDYMHKKGVIHCDIKSKNILLSYETNSYSVSIAAISDFNLSFCAKETANALLDNEVCLLANFSPDEVSPEVFRMHWITLKNRKIHKEHVKSGANRVLQVYMPEGYGCGVDMWGVGIILRELYTFHRVFLWLPCNNHKRLLRGGYNHTCPDCVYEHLMGLCTSMSGVAVAHDMNHLIKDKDAQDVIRQLLVVPPRPSAAEILLSPYIKSLDRVKKISEGVLDTSLNIVPHKVQPPISTLTLQDPQPSQPPRVLLRDLKPKPKKKQAPAPPPGVAPLMLSEQRKLNQASGFTDLKTVFAKEQEDEDDWASFKEQIPGGEHTGYPTDASSSVKHVRLKLQNDPSPYMYKVTSPDKRGGIPDDIITRQKGGNSMGAPGDFYFETNEDDIKKEKCGDESEGEQNDFSPYICKVTSEDTRGGFPDDIKTRQKGGNSLKAPEDSYFEMSEDDIKRGKGGDKSEGEQNESSREEYDEEAIFGPQPQMLGSYHSRHRPYINAYSTEGTMSNLYVGGEQEI